MRRIPFAWAILGLALACATGSVEDRVRSASLAGDRDAAFAVLENALEGADPRSDLPRRIALLDRMARMNEHEERFAEAEPLYEESLKLSLLEYGEADPNTADRINNIGALVHKRGRYAEADGHYRRALAIYDAALEPDSLRATTTMANLGMLDRLMQRDAEAVDLVTRTLT
ncbi:MAG: tetratricopeptide repeat protein [Deltaproteobacteria bacterium]|nr:tetratricopeptide repeat protein [Deltaproteobacteria bacterium]